MTYTEKINQKIEKYNQEQLNVPKQISESNPNLPDDLIEMLIKLTINKNITLFTADVHTFILELNNMVQNTEEEPQDIIVARERARLFLNMMVISKEISVRIPDFSSNDPGDILKLKVLMKKYSEIPDQNYRWEID